jgi:predicted RNA binding protein YcfA (HicA-like mRNA interferase family)
MLEAIGFQRLRSGKGSHVIYARGTDRVTIAGAPGHEMPKGQWESLRKEFALGEKER